LYLNFNEFKVKPAGYLLLWVKPTITFYRTCLWGDFEAYNMCRRANQPNGRVCLYSTQTWVETTQHFLEWTEPVV